MKRRRRKIKKGITSNEISPSSLKQSIRNDALFGGIVRPMLSYMLHIECLKRNYFNPEYLLQMNIGYGKYSLLAFAFEEYLEKALSYTYKEIGTVNEPELQWILSDTPISPWMFNFIKYKYKKYLTRQQ